MNENTGNRLAKLKRRFLIRTIVISAAAAGTALAVSAVVSPGHLASVSCGVVSAVVSAFLCSVMIIKSVQGRFIGSPENQLIAAVGLGALLRIALLAAALFVSVRLSGFPLATGLVFIALFVPFRGSEIFFIKGAGASEEENLARKDSQAGGLDSAPATNQNVKESVPSDDGGRIGSIDERRSAQESHL